MLAEEGRLAEAADLAKRTLAVRRRQTSDWEGTARTQLYLGRVLVEQNKLDEAEPLLQDALTQFREHVAVKADLAPQAANWLGTIQVARKDYLKAEALMLPGSERFFAPAAEMSPNERRVAVGHILKLYEAWDRPKEAADWKKKLDGLGKKSSTL